MSKTIRSDTLVSLSIAFVIATLYFLVNYNWLQANRFGGLLDIDEAGYTAMAVNFARQLMGGGFWNWLHAFSYPTVQAPLAYASASLFMYFSELSENGGMISSAVFSSISIFFTFLLARRLSSTWAALLVTLFLISNPYFTAYSRTFVFTAASSATFLMLIYFFCLSDGLAKTFYSACAGLCLGLFLLSRTVNISFLPGIFIAYVCFWASTPKQPRGRFVSNFLLALLIALLVAGSWYYVHWKEIAQYLFSYGYGAQASEYANNNAGGFRSIFIHAYGLFRRMHPGHMILTAAMLGVFFIAVAFNFKSISKNDRTIFSIFLVLLFFLCFGTLLTSENMGSGFDVPLIPVLVIGLIAATANLVSAGNLKILGGAGVAIISLALFIPQIDDSWCRNLNDDPKWPSAPHPWFSCGGTIRSYLEQGGGFDKLGGLIPTGIAIDRNIEKRWILLNELVARKIEQLNPKNKLVTFAHRHILSNVNTIQLWLIMNRGYFFPAAQMNPSDMEDSVEGYKRWSSQGQYSSTCLFITNTKADGQFPPAPTYEFLAAALRQEGLQEIASLPFPEGHQTIVIWRRANMCS